MFRYDGDLTISIAPNLDITILNHQLVLPEYDINAQGQQYIKNDSNREILLYSLQDINKNDLPLFGDPFLTAAHLLVDYNNGVFTLSQSQPSTNVDLVALGPPVCSTSSSAPAQAPESSSSDKRELSKGAIAGAVVGGVAFLSLCLTAILVLAKRKAKNRRRIEAKEAVAHKGAVYKSETASNSMHSKPEMPADRHPPLEMPLVRDTSYAVEPYELPLAHAYELPAGASSVNRSRKELPG